MTGLTIGLVCIFFFGIWGIFSAIEISAQFCPTSPSACGFGNWGFGTEITALAGLGILVTVGSGIRWFGMFHAVKDRKFTLHH
jgi:hypothetical protein